MLLGIAALESGRPNLATFIFERVLAVNPGHTAARLEMARSYFALGDAERAEREFRAVLASDPLPPIRSLVARYLDRLRAQVSPAGAPLGAYVEIAIGRDSNVNAAVSSGGLFAAEPLPSRESDRFAALGAGAAFSARLDGRHTVFAGLDFAQRMHADLDRFDSRAAALHLGLQRRLSERDSLRVTLEHDEYDLDHSSFRRAQGAAAEWTRYYGERASLALFAEGLRIRYLDEALRSTSSNLLLAGVRGGRALDASGRTLGRASLYAGHDDAVHGRPDGDRRLLGASASLQRSLAPRLEGYAGLSFVDSRYRQHNAFAGGAREDRYISAELGLLWHLRPGWFLRPQLSRMHNRSNVPFSEYGRTEVSLTLRRSLP